MTAFPLSSIKLEVYELCCSNEPDSRVWGLSTGLVKKQAGAIGLHQRTNSIEKIQKRSEFGFMGVSLGFFFSASSSYGSFRMPGVSACCLLLKISPQCLD